MTTVCLQSSIRLKTGRRWDCCGGKQLVIALFDPTAKCMNEPRTSMTARPYFNYLNDGSKKERHLNGEVINIQIQTRYKRYGQRLRPIGWLLLFPNCQILPSPNIDIDSHRYESGRQESTWLLFFLSNKH